MTTLSSQTAKLNNLADQTNFYFRDGELMCEHVKVNAAAEEFGTPLYLYSRAAILENYRRLEAGLADLPCLICYSVKANSNLALLTLMHEAGAGFDVVSGGELERALHAGADPQGIVFSGVGKNPEELNAALRSGLRMINVESEGELEELRRYARLAGVRAPLAIRVNPDVEAETHPYISTGQHIHKFGVPKEVALQLYRDAAKSPHLNPRGIACHIGSQILDVDPFLKAFDEVRSLADLLRAEGLAIEDLDIGGGFGIPYRGETPLDFPGLTSGLAARLRGTPYRLILEPGRAIIGSAGVLVTRVLYVKRNPAKNFVVVDSGMNDLLRPALYGSHHEVIPARLRAAEKIVADVVGPLCETGDFLAQDRELPDVLPGDLLAVMTAGAYGYALSSNYNSRPRPAEALVDGERIRLIRRRESLEDLMALDVIE